MLTFILRLTTDGAGPVSGIVERVKTGEKHRFHGLDALAPLLAQLVAVETTTAETRGRTDR